MKYRNALLTDLDLPDLGLQLHPYELVDFSHVDAAVLAGSASFQSAVNLCWLTPIATSIIIVHTVVVMDRDALAVNHDCSLKSWSLSPNELLMEKLAKFVYCDQCRAVRRSDYGAWSSFMSFKIATCGAASRQARSNSYAKTSFLPDCSYCNNSGEGLGSWNYELGCYNMGKCKYCNTPTAR